VSYYLEGILFRGETEVRGGKTGVYSIRKKD
jgi:hypothetical protein